MEQFNKDKRYLFGVLKTGIEYTDPSPEFVSKPKSQMHSGQRLIHAGYKTFDDFLSKYQHGFGNDKIVSCYEQDETGSMKHFASATPLQNHHTTIDDRGNTIFQLPPQGQNNEFVENEMKRLQNKITQLEAKAEMDREKYYSEKEEWLNQEAKLDKQIVKLETQLKAYEDFTKGMTEGQALNDKGKTDPKEFILGVLNSSFGSAIGGMIANNPKMQKGVESMIDKFGGGGDTSIESGKLESEMRDI